MDKVKLSLAILRSPDRSLIEDYLEAAFGERNVWRINSPNLEVFVTDVLNKLFPKFF